MSLIEFQNVSKCYGEKKILNDVSFRIDEGDFACIIGESGAGKSTILNIIGLLEKVDKGNYTLCGRNNLDINSKGAIKILRENIAYLFQNFALIDEETVLYNLKIAQKYVNKTKEEKLKELKEALKLVGLEGIEKNKIYQLSGGEQQRVALARVLLKSNNIILADEPTGSLDEKNAIFIMNILKELNKKGKTVVMVTHQKELVNYSNKTIKLARNQDGIGSCIKIE